MRQFSSVYDNMRTAGPSQADMHTWCLCEQSDLAEQIAVHQRVNMYPATPWGAAAQKPIGQAHPEDNYYLASTAVFNVVFHCKTEIYYFPNL